MEAQHPDNIPGFKYFRIPKFDPDTLLPEHRLLHDKCIELCRIGDAPGLAEFFSSHSILPGSEPLYTSDNRSKDAPWVPHVFDLLRHAAVNRHKEIIALVLQIYPKVLLDQSFSVVKAAVQGGDLEILQMLQSHSPEFATQEDMITSTLIYSLASPDPRVPKFFPRLWS
jgi:hypothetical protein